jgi:hypothetical protein
MRYKRNGQIIRQWRLLLALDHKQWFSLYELRECLPNPKPHKRTIMRDMEALAVVFPIERRTASEKGIPEFQYRLQQPFARLLKK